jgi:hypothetical protein
MSERSLDTICLGCCFAQGQYTDSMFEQTYNGCHLKVLQKMRKLGAEIGDAEDEHNNKFHIIYGRLCPFYRPQRWRADMDMDECTKLARKEVALKADTVLYCNDQTTVVQLRHTLDCLANNTLPPTSVYVVNHRSNIKPSEFISTMQQYPFKWRLESILEDCDVGRALDITTKKCTGIFVAYFQAGFEVPTEFFASIDTALHDELQRIILLEPVDDQMNGLVVLRMFYGQAGGNNKRTIIDKAKNISEDQECQELVRPITEIVPQLKSTMLHLSQS